MNVFIIENLLKKKIIFYIFTEYRDGGESEYLTTVETDQCFMSPAVTRCSRHVTLIKPALLRDIHSLLDPVTDQHKLIMYYTLYPV